jgi:hypothetical protein
MSEVTEAVHKVSLKSGRVVMLRDPKISDMEHATSIAGKGNFDNQALLGSKVQKEMLKLLITSIGKNDENGEYQGKKPSLTEIQQLDTLFTLREYNQLCSVVRKLCEADAEGNENTEIAFEDSSSK